MKYSIILLSFFFTFDAAAQQIFQNKKGGYQLTVPEKWTTRQENEITSVYAPDEGEMDTWKEKLEISVYDGKELSLGEAYDFYIEKDFPSAYSSFTLVKQGEEDIRGTVARWAVFSFTGTGTVGSGEVSFTLYTLFYLVLKNEKLYMLNGIAEKDFFPRYENDYLKIIRSFRVIK